MNEPLLTLNPQAAEQLRAACAQFGTRVERFGRLVAQLGAGQPRPEPTPCPEASE